MPSVTFLRHGQSLWNLERRYTGWTDVELSHAGKRQAERAGRLLHGRGFRFDLAFTSVLSRARETLEITLAEMGASSTEVQSSWRLNERHYGALQGMYKSDARERYEPQMLFRWVRSFDTAPPPLSPAQHRELQEDPLYASVPPTDLPATESLADTLARTLPYWKSSIEPAIREGRQVLVVAHLNSLRALVKELEGISNTELPGLSLQTGEPFVVQLGPDLEFERRSFVRFQPAHVFKRWTRKISRGRKARAWLTESP